MRSPSYAAFMQALTIDAAVASRMEGVLRSALSTFAWKRSIGRSCGNMLLISFSRLPSWRSEEHTSELQSLMRISYAVFCLKKKTNHTDNILQNISRPEVTTAQKGHR